MDYMYMYMYSTIIPVRAKPFMHGTTLSFNSILPFLANVLKLTLLYHLCEQFCNFDAEISFFLAALMNMFTYTTIHVEEGCVHVHVCVCVCTYMCA